ncbi:hypothetical protein GYB29_03845 [bacterium]|nr:hypothetical protein [Balneola sp.]MBR9916824.1 hypothetical protein [bacterium]
MKIIRVIISGLFLCTILSATVLSQVTIAPTNMFLDDNSRFGTFMVINNSQQPQEISVDFLFGYFDTNEFGDKSFVRDSSEIAQNYSIAESVRAFPQNFVLQSGDRQIVRLRINASQDLVEQTYWARIRTTSTPESPPLELGASDAVNAQIGVKFEQITGLFYKVGETNTGININQIRTRMIDDNTIQILSDFERTGNSPFLGTVTTSIIKDGKIMRTSSLSTSFYFDGTHGQNFNIEDMEPGSYQVKVEFVSERNDVSEQDLVQMSPSVSSTTVQIQ